jgi:uncharacterized protein (DUF4415 family)
MTSRKTHDADNPEWTKDDFAKAKNPEAVLSPDVLAAFGKKRGAQRAPKKVAVSIRLNPVVVTYFKKQGPGWQSRIDDVLMKIAKKKPTSAQRRKVS